MCDYSLHHVKTRPAKVSDKLTTHNFGTGARGFSASEDANVAVCVLPGTELSFADEVRITRRNPWPDVINYKTAIFRQINQDDPRAHHDALEFPNGELVLLTFLAQGQQATVLQLPLQLLALKPRNERPTFNPLSVTPTEKALILRPIEALPLVSALKLVLADLQHDQPRSKIRPWKYV